METTASQADEIRSRLKALRAEIRELELMLAKIAVEEGGFNRWLGRNPNMISETILPDALIVLAVIVVIIWIYLMWGDRL